MCNSHDKAKRLVQNDVYVCLSMLVTHLMSVDESFQDEYYNQDFTVKVDCYDCDGEDDDCWACDENGEAQELREPLEYWSVSNWLAEKLRNEDESVIDYCGLNIWCRTASGQAIYMDYVINQIANN